MLRDFEEEDHESVGECNESHYLGKIYTFDAKVLHATPLRLDLDDKRWLHFNTKIIQKSINIAIYMSHSKNTMFCLPDVAWGDQHRQAQHLTSVFRKNDSVVPKACSWKVAAGLSFIAINYLLLHSLLFLCRELFSFFF